MRMKGTIMETIVQAKRVLEIFKEMSQIPRESGNEKGISDYIVNFAKNLGQIGRASCRERVFRAV